MSPTMKNVKKPKIGFDCVAERLEKVFYSIPSSKPAPPTAYGHMNTVQKHLKLLFASSTKDIKA